MWVDYITLIFQNFWFRVDDVITSNVISKLILTKNFVIILMSSLAAQIFHVRFVI